MKNFLAFLAVPFGLFAGCLALPVAAPAQGLTIGQAKPAIEQGVATAVAAMKTHGMVGIEMTVQGCYLHVPTGGLSLSLLRCLGEDTAGLRFAEGGYEAKHFPIPPYFAMPAFHARAMTELARHGVTAPAAVSNTMNHVMTIADAAMIRDTKPQ